jgi:hypothetical protein
MPDFCAEAGGSLFPKRFDFRTKRQTMFRPLTALAANILNGARQALRSGAGS